MANTADPRISVVQVSIGNVEVTLFGFVPLTELLADASSLAPA